MKRNRDGLRHNSNNEDENDNNTVWKDKGGEIGDAPLLVVTKANLLKMDGLLRSTLTVEEGKVGTSNKQVKVSMRHFRKRISQCCQDLCLLEDNFNEENAALSEEWFDLCKRLREVKVRLRVKRARVPHLAELTTDKQLQLIAKMRFEGLVDSSTHIELSENLKKRRTELGVTVEYTCDQLEKVKGLLEECVLKVPSKADSLRSTMLSVKNLLEGSKRGMEAFMRLPPPKPSGLFQQTSNVMCTYPFQERKQYKLALSKLSNQSSSQQPQQLSSAAEAREKEREVKSNDLRMKKNSTRDAILARLLNHIP